MREGGKGEGGRGKGGRIRGREGQRVGRWEVDWRPWWCSSRYSQDKYESWVKSKDVVIVRFECVANS